MLNGCAVANYFDSHYGKVIDLSTREPIQGAAVLAIYNTSGLDHTERVDAVEVITNEKGYFKIPGRFLFTFRFLGSWNPLPQIFIYKPGYGCFPYSAKKKVFTDVNSEEIYFIPDYSLPSGTSLTIALDKLTLEKRQHADCIGDGDVPYEKMRELRKLQFEESINLGYESSNQKLFYAYPALFMAISYSDYEYVEQLIKSTNYSKLDNAVKSSFIQYAKQQRNKQIIELLSHHQ